MKRFAILAALTAVAFISVVLTLFAFLTIADSISFWCEIHFSPHWLHENGENNALPTIPFCLLLTVVGWSSAHHLWLYWKRLAPQAPAPAEAEGKTGSDPPSPQEEKQLGWKHIAAFAALIVATLLSTANTLVTIESFHTLFTPFNILSTVVCWILAHRLWRTWKRTAPRVPTSAEAKMRGIL
jgi:hypothetical protein